MGEWLTNHGVPFRCIAYTPVEMNERKFVSFSTVFDQSTQLLFPVDFRSSIREPGYFWHNIADNSETWWRTLVERGEIPACFEEHPEKAERLLKGYIKGDTIVAYARGYGAVGWGVIESPKYQLLKPGDSGDKLRGNCLHRLKIHWQAAAYKLSEGLSPDIVRKEFDIYHPLSTSVSMDSDKAKRLIDALSDRLAVQ
jgi:hypothetical protein